MPDVIRDIEQWRALRRQIPTDQSIGFVATMGNLHEGHASLLQRSRVENDISVLSIFVNPSQFDNPDDLAAYARTLSEDLSIARACGVDYVLTPDETMMYPDNFAYRISETEKSTMMEGQYRAGHFTGVLTVVMKFLQLVKPHRSYWGEKDYQQYELVRAMADAFFLDVDVIPCPTVRTAAGFALSSRNARINSEQRSLAEHFPKLLAATDRSCAQIKTELSKLGFNVDYIQEHQGRRYGAVSLGDVRLIDNVRIKTC